MRLMLRRWGGDLVIVVINLSILYSLQIRMHNVFS